MENLKDIDYMAKKINVHKSWLYGKTRTNEIPHYKVGKYVRFDEIEVWEWLKEQNEAE
jgi:excisionase family DNA binding protein